MSKFIHTQGDLDGACFLYSLINASQSIGKKSFSRTQWNSMIAQLKNTTDFLRSDIGTAESDDFPSRQEKLANLVLATAFPKGAYAARWISPLNKHSKLDTLITLKSSIVLSNKSHWYTVVDVCNDDLYLACSWRRHDPDVMYKEEESPRLTRKYNQITKRSELRVFRTRGLQVFMQ